jgi:hypothetical protein
MNTTLTAPSELIARIDGIEAPAPGRWTVAPGHSWFVLRARPGRFASKATACGAAVSGFVDIAADPEHCRMSLAVDTRRLGSGRPKLSRTLGEQQLRIDAVRTGNFATGGWDIAGSVAGGDENCAFDAWVEYRGVYCRRRDLAYAWFIMNLTVPARALGLSGGQRRRLPDVAMSVELLATADRLATPAVA